MAKTFPQTVPFFIVGCSRSGTTLLQALVDGHPNVTIPPESQIYTRFGPIFHTYGDFTVARNRRRLINDLLRDAYIQQWGLDISAADVERQLKHPSRAGIVEALFSLYAAKTGARRWGDKTPEHIRYLHEIRKDFPDAKLIHLVRDGRDVAEAMRRMIWCPVSAVGLAREWRRETGYWDQFCEHAGTRDTLILRYEDLVTAPQVTLAKVLEFINEPFLDTVSTYASTPLSQALGAQIGWHSSLLQGITSTKIGLYREHLTSREIEIFESLTSEALIRYGYGTDNRYPRKPTLAERLYGFIADPLVRWYRKLFHLEVVGWDLQFRTRTIHRRFVSALR